MGPLVSRKSSSHPALEPLGANKAGADGWVGLGRVIKNLTMNVGNANNSRTTLQSFA